MKKEIEESFVWQFRILRDLIGLWLVDWGISIMTREQLKGLVVGIVEESKKRK